MSPNDNEPCDPHAGDYVNSAPSVRKTEPDPQQLDITGAELVQVEIDHRRKVLYVHVDGYTALRICRIKEILPTQEHVSIPTSRQYSERLHRAAHKMVQDVRKYIKRKRL